MLHEDAGAVTAEQHSAGSVVVDVAQPVNVLQSSAHGTQKA